jgi:hypothetical protein
MSVIFKDIKLVFNKYKNFPNLEMEFRLGKFNGYMFDTNIGEEVFTTIMESLKAYEGWEAVKTSNVTSYYLKDTRMDFDEDTEESLGTINKKRITKLDRVIQPCPFDIRFSVSQELPAEDMDTEAGADFMRVKQRTSFIRKNLSIDLTVVSGQQEDMDDESENVYQIEFEIMDPTAVSTDNELYNIIYKIDCVLKCIGESQ